MTLTSLLNLRGPSTPSPSPPPHPHSHSFLGKPQHRGDLFGHSEYEIWKGGQKKGDKDAALAALTLLAFLFFLHILQACLKDMTDYNQPSMVVMNTGAREDMPAMVAVPVATMAPMPMAPIAMPAAMPVRNRRHAAASATRPHQDADQDEDEEDSMAGAGSGPRRTAAKENGEFAQENMPVGEIPIGSGVEYCEGCDALGNPIPAPAMEAADAEDDEDDEEEVEEELEMEHLGEEDAVAGVVNLLEALEEHGMNVLGRGAPRRSRARRSTTTPGDGEGEGAVAEERARHLVRVQGQRRRVGAGEGAVPGAGRREDTDWEAVPVLAPSSSKQVSGHGKVPMTVLKNAPAQSTSGKVPGQVSSQVLAHFIAKLPVQAPPLQASVQEPGKHVPNRMTLVPPVVPTAAAAASEEADGWKTTRKPTFTAHATPDGNGPGHAVAAAQPQKYASGSDSHAVQVNLVEPSKGRPAPPPPPPLSPAAENEIVRIVSITPPPVSRPPRPGASISAWTSEDSAEEDDEEGDDEEGAAAAPAHGPGGNRGAGVMNKQEEYDLDAKATPAPGPVTTPTTARTEAAVDAAVPVPVSVAVPVPMATLYPFPGNMANMLPMLQPVPGSGLGPGRGPGRPRPPGHVITYVPLASTFRSVAWRALNMVTRPILKYIKPDFEDAFCCEVVACEAQRLGTFGGSFGERVARTVSEVVSWACRGQGQQQQQQLAAKEDADAMSSEGGSAAEGGSAVEGEDAAEGGGCRRQIEQCELRAGRRTAVTTIASILESLVGGWKARKRNNKD